MQIATRNIVNVNSYVWRWVKISDSNSRNSQPPIPLIILEGFYNLCSRNLQL
jgi:hypothetical protein